MGWCWTRIGRVRIWIGSIREFLPLFLLVASLFYSVKFSGVTNTAVNTTLECETVDGVAQCMTTDPGYTWVAPISDVKW